MNAGNAYQMRVQDPAMRAYLQRYPFLLGPDPAMNASGLRAMLDNFSRRTASRDSNQQAVSDSVTRLSPSETVLPEDVMTRLTTLFAAEPFTQAQIAEMLDDYGWEANLVPRGATSILALGCGEGHELLFLRAVCPEARITGVDYTDSVPSVRKRSAGLEFFGGDMDEILEGFRQDGKRFDLIYSNHTLEHLYMPDEVLTLLCALINPGGAMISTLPMDAVEGSPFLETVARVAETKTIHPLDIVFMDAGHPWKTNPADVRGTFLGAGFKQVDLFQRSEHLSRPIAASEQRFYDQRKRGLGLHRMFFGVPRAILKTLFGSQPPANMIRLLLKIEFKYWFGSNILKNRYTPEVTVLAHKQA